MKRDPALVPLSHGHHHALVATLRVRRMLARGLDGDGMRRLASEVRQFVYSDLEPHFQAEESLILPTLNSVAPELVARTIAEHAALRALFPDDLRDPAPALARWCDLLPAHIRFEERDLFEVAQLTVPVDELSAIGAALANLTTEPRLPGEPLGPDDHDTLDGEIAG